MQKRGLTLIDLLIFIAAVGLLSAVALATLSDSRAENRDLKRISEVGDVILAIRAYHSEHGEYPANLGELVSDSYLVSLPKDPITGANPWYSSYGDHSHFHIGVDLETNHTILRTDSDEKGAEINGMDFNGCAGAFARHCYDLYM